MMTGITRLDVYELELRKDILMGVEKEVAIAMTQDMMSAYGLDGFARIMMEACRQTAEDTAIKEVAELQIIYQSIINDMLVKADTLVGRRC